MNQLIYNGWTFSDDEVGSGNYFSQTSLTSSSLGINTLEASVKCPDPTITDFQQNSPVTYFHKGQQKGIYYLQSVERTGPDRYTLSCVSAMGLLSQRRHVGGIYTGHTVEEVVASICGDIPVMIKNNLRGIQLYGWLPYVAPPKTSAKDNLSQVLFAIGAAVTNDLNGVLRIEPLFRGLSGVLDDDSVCEGGSVVTDSLVTAVSVTEHQYFKGTETKELFEGSTLTGDVITFSEPMHSLVADGFELLEIGANYAVVSSGSGTLTGSVYVHNTRQVTAAVAEGPVANVKSVEDATLVSLVNSTAVVQRLAAYYRCRETIKTPAIITTEHPGAVVSVFHPYDKKQVRACIASSDVNMSATLKSDLEALVDYEPPDVSQQEYFDTREILTGDGEWDPPEGVENVTAVLIGGAQGGWSGKKGNDASSTAQSYSTNTGSGYFPSKAGEGGDPGKGGLGGKILTVNVSVQTGVRIPYSSGVGGPGGIASESDTVEGSFGTPSVFGEHSSDNGAASENGYVDITTGERFASLGDSGIKGGKGAGVVDNPSLSAETFIEEGETITDDTGTAWTPGSIPTTPIPFNYVECKAGFYDSTYIGTVTVGASRGCGGGAAVGANGSEGEAGYYRIRTSSDSSDNYVYALSCTSGPGGSGANAVAPEKELGNIGKGGRGGHGGGGGGGTGICEYSVSPRTGYTIQSTQSMGIGTPGPGGLGSDGAPGGDGCIILYYRIPKDVHSGALMDRSRRLILDRTGRLLIV